MKLTPLRMAARVPPWGSCSMGLLPGTWAATQSDGSSMPSVTSTVHNRPKRPKRAAAGRHLVIKVPRAHTDPSLGPLVHLRFADRARRVRQRPPRDARRGQRRDQIPRAGETRPTTGGPLDVAARFRSPASHGRRVRAVEVVSIERWDCLWVLLGVICCAGLAQPLVLNAAAHRRRVGVVPRFAIV